MHASASRANIKPKIKNFTENQTRKRERGGGGGGGHLTSSLPTLRRTRAPLPSSSHMLRTDLVTVRNIVSLDSAGQELGDNVDQGRISRFYRLQSLTQCRWKEWKETEPEDEVKIGHIMNFNYRYTVMLFVIRKRLKTVNRFSLMRQLFKGATFR